MHRLVPKSLTEPSNGSYDVGVNKIDPKKPLSGLRIASFESRHSSNMAKLLEKRGATPLQAPSLQEVPYQDHTDAIAFGEVLLAGNCSCLIVMTGVGTKILIEAMSTRWPQELIVAALSKATIISRGPKPVATLKQYGLKPLLVADPPNTWEKVLELLDDQWPISQKRIHVQEYGARNQAFIDELKKRQADVCPIPIYGWQLPDDTGPLQIAIHEIIQGKVDCMVFTSSHQISNLMHVANEIGQESSLRHAMERVIIASIGPVTGAAIRKQGFTVDIVPEKHKMGHLVKAISDEAPERIAHKKSKTAQ
ncbi:MAG: uroporphyrinogen-III synthase [Deltaproteobacteria bacterium]|jgi:uroporphyrinogen-III synthase|nr:uroporphyrinogen-III synthase [Deltaproteobacteria bacterium]MBT6434362.1 uroporphyrinogen-III synthase [Deltaproteobacteria bacterium]